MQVDLIAKIQRMCALLGHPNPLPSQYSDTFRQGVLQNLKRYFDVLVSEERSELLSIIRGNKYLRWLKDLQGDQHQEEDILQTALKRAYEHICTFRYGNSPDAFKAWFSKIANNVLKSELRKELRRTPPDSISSDQPIITDTDDGDIFIELPSEDSVEKRVLIEMLLAKKLRIAMERCAPHQVIVFVMKDEEFLNWGPKDIIRLFGNVELGKLCNQLGKQLKEWFIAYQQEIAEAFEHLNWKVKPIGGKCLSAYWAGSEDPENIIQMWVRQVKKQISKAFERNGVQRQQDLL